MAALSLSDSECCSSKLMMSKNAQRGWRSPSLLPFKERQMCLCWSIIFSIGLHIVTQGLLSPVTKKTVQGQNQSARAKHGPASLVASHVPDWIGLWRNWELQIYNNDSGPAQPWFLRRLQLGGGSGWCHPWGLLAPQQKLISTTFFRCLGNHYDVQDWC